MVVRTALPNGIVLLTLDRPARLNAIDGDTCVELARAIRSASGDPTVRGIVLNGAGRAFTAGVDLSDLERAMLGPDAARALLACVQDLTRAIVACARPTAVALHGWVVGMGVELSLCTDVRAAHPDAQLMMPERARGVEVTNAASWTLPHILGAVEAEALLRTGRKLGAEEARALGLIHVVSDDPLDAACNAILSGTAPRNPLRDLTREELEAVLAYETERIVAMAAPTK